MSNPENLATESMLTIRQAAALFGVSTKTLRRRLSQGDIEGAVKRSGTTGPEWALPIAGIEALGYRPVPGRELPPNAVADDHGTDDTTALARETEAWRRRALAAESLAEEQAQILESVRRERAARPEHTTGPMPSTVFSQRPAQRSPVQLVPASPRDTPRSPTSHPRSRRRTPAMWRTTIFVGVVVLAFAAGLLWSGDRTTDGNAQQAASGALASPTPSTVAVVTPTTGPAPPQTTATTVADEATPPPTVGSSPAPTTTPPDLAPVQDSPLDPANPTVGPGPPSATPATVTLVRGDSFWTVAETQVSATLGRAATDAEIAPYWVALMAANTDVLPEPGNPNLLHVGTVLVLPPT